MKQLLILLALFPLTLNAQRPTGIVAVGSNSTNCTAGFTCTNIVVTSPDLAEGPGCRQAILGVKRTNQTVLGTVVIFSGHAGQQWFVDDDLSAAWANDMVSRGFDIVQVKFNGLGWTNPWQAGMSPGFIRTGERPATIIKWVYDNWHRGGDYDVVGTSQGSMALAIAMAMYGCNQYVDKAVYVSGPPMSELVTACLATDNRRVTGGGPLIDAPDGWIYSQSGHGPCNRQVDTPINRARWTANSAETLDDGIRVGLYRYPNTTISFIVGLNDSPCIQIHAQILIDKFISVGQPVNVLRPDGMGHDITKSINGLAALTSVLAQP